MRCKGKTKSGDRCKREAREGSKYCYQHQPEYEQVDYEDMTLDELKDELTEKQKAFADEYIISLNATEAARKAGYSENSAREIGHENLTKPNIKNYIQKRLDEKEAERIATQDEVLEYLTRVMRAEEKETFVKEDKDGNIEVKEYDPAIKERTKAAKLLGKRYAVFVDKQELEINELPTINLVRGKENGS